MGLQKLKLNKNLKLFSREIKKVKRLIIMVISLCYALNYACHDNLIPLFDYELNHTIKFAFNNSFLI